MKSLFQYFRSSSVIAALGIVLAYFVAGLEGVFVCSILAILEISLSFDNAVVNASVLKSMSPVWRRRFLTWGILIAVFGMRIVFPLGIVALTAHLNPWEAISLAAHQPEQYAAVMRASHIPVAAFGGSFLLMVALRYFFNEHKNTHWLGPIERVLIRLGKLDAIEIAIGLITILCLARSLDHEDAQHFLFAGIAGLIVFIVVDGASALLARHGGHSHTQNATPDLHKASLAMFVYLEVLDASFSFDGVVGAFAIINNLFVIAIGLGIGAMFVRSLTVMLVDRGTLTQFRYLEQGAFWAIGALAILMYASTLREVPEVVTGLSGALIIGFSLVSSIRHRG